jgi:3-oxoacyl-[acyl-carrier-protein] synthase II
MISRPHPPPFSDRDIAITSWGAVSAFGVGRRIFSEGLLAGRPAVRRITRFDPAGLDCRIAAEAADFDPASVQDAQARRQTGRVTGLALAAGREAFSARFGTAPLPLEKRRRIGVILGTGGAAAAFAEAQYAHYFAGNIRKATAFAVPSITPGTLASELSMALDLHGPSHVISTGCTSAADALGYARFWLNAGLLDAVLVGGADDPIAPGIMEGFCLMGAVATDSNENPARGCRPFSANRGGLVIAEGAFFFMLERVESARAAGIAPLATIAGYASTCEAFHRVRIKEDGDEPARAITLALAEAGLRPEELGHVSAHGTGTELGDRLETRALKLALGDAAKNIPVSAPKSMLGHPQGASAAQGLAAVLAAFEADAVPPTINLEIPDPLCDLDYTPGKARPGAGEAALVNCIGFGSKNSAMIVRKWR